MGSRYFAGTTRLPRELGPMLGGFRFERPWARLVCSTQRSCRLRRASSLRVRRAARAQPRTASFPPNLDCGSTRPAGQHQKRGLECVFRLVPISQGLIADPKPWDRAASTRNRKRPSRPRPHGPQIVPEAGHRSSAEDSSGEQTPDSDEIRTRGWSSCHDIHSPTATLFFSL